MSYLQKIKLEISEGIGERQSHVYSEARTAFVQFSGSKSVRFQTDKGVQLENRFRFVFPPGFVYGHVMNASGESVEMTEGTRITFDKRYYIAERINAKVDKYNRPLPVEVDCADGGAAPVEVIAENDPVLDGQGVDHNITPSQQSAIGGGVTAAGL